MRSGQRRREERDLTLWQVWRHVRHFLGVDVRPVKVIVGILLVVALGEALVERAAPCNQKKKNDGGIVLVVGLGETTIAGQKISDEGLGTLLCKCNWLHLQKCHSGATISQ